jgi:hypothetical protein
VLDESGASTGVRHLISPQRLAGRGGAVRTLGVVDSCFGLALARRQPSGARRARTPAQARGFGPTTPHGYGRSGIAGRDALPRPPHRPSWGTTLAFGPAPSPALPSTGAERLTDPSLLSDRRSRVEVAGSVGAKRTAAKRASPSLCVVQSRLCRCRRLAAGASGYPARGAVARDLPNVRRGLPRVGWAAAPHGLSGCS